MEGLHTGENIGGILEIGICHVDDIESSEDSILFKTNKWWTIVEFIPKTATFIDDESDTDHGILFTYSGVFKRQFPSKSDEIIFSRFIGQCVVMRIVDLNGQSRIIGSKQYPVSLFRKGDRGSKPNDLAHHEFRYNVSQPKRAF